VNRKELENRLIEFAVLIIEICTVLPNIKAGNHLSGQLVRSGTSPALNYGEAQSAESKNDFIHKLQIILKELRETVVNLKIINRASLLTEEEDINKLKYGIREGNELISIFVKSVATSKNKMR